MVRERWEGAEGTSRSEGELERERRIDLSLNLIH